MRAKNAEGAGAWSGSGSATTNDNQAPEITTQKPLSITVAENTASGTDIGSAIAASDGDDDPITWSLSGTHALQFAINSSGQISTASVLNYEAGGSRTFIARASDPHGGSDTITVNVTVTDLTEPPGTPNAPIVSAASRTSLSVSWNAPSNTGPAINDYDVQFRQGNSGNWMSKSHTGATARTTITDLEFDTSYQVQVRAKSDEGTSAWSNSGSGRTHANQAPEILISDPLALTVPQSTPSDTDIGDAVPARDPEGDPITWRLEGPDAELFAIDGGQISTAVDFHFELNTVFTFTAIASDPYGGSDSISVNVTVTTSLSERKILVERAHRSILPRVLISFSNDTLSSVEDRLERINAIPLPPAPETTDDNQLSMTRLYSMTEPTADDDRNFHPEALSTLSSLSYKSNLEEMISDAELWGAGSYRNLAGETEMFDWSGHVYGLRTGVDIYAYRQWVAGILLEVTRGVFDWTQSRPDADLSKSGTYDLEMTTIAPYFGWASEDDKWRAWGYAGLGKGEVTMEDDGLDGVIDKSDLSTTPVALGVSRHLTSSDTMIPGGSTSLRVKGEAITAPVKITEQEENSSLLDPFTIDAERIELSVELIHERKSEDGVKLEPSLQLGILENSTNEERFSAIDLGFGLRYANPNLGLKLNTEGSVLASSEDDTEEWGVNLTLSYDKEDDNLGPTLDLSSSYGAVWGGGFDLWSESGIIFPKDGVIDSQASMDIEFGYGLLTRKGTALFIPYVGSSLTEDNSSNYRFGSWWMFDEGLRMNLETNYQTNQENRWYGIRFTFEVPL